MNFLRYSRKPDPNQLFIRLKSVVFSISTAMEGQDNPDKKNQGYLSGFQTKATPRRSSLDFIARDYSIPGYSVQYFPFSPGYIRNSSDQCQSDTQRTGSFGSGKCQLSWVSLICSTSRAADTSLWAIKC